MNSTCDQFLARTRFPKNHHRGRGAPGHHVDAFHHIPDDITLPDEAGDVLDQVPLLQGLDLFPETDRLEGIANRHLQGFHLQGLHDVVLCAQSHGLHGRAYVIVPRDHEDEGFGVKGPDLAEHPDPVLSGKADVQKHQIRRILHRLRDRLVPRCEGLHLVGLLERQGQGVPDPGIVVHDIDGIADHAFSRVVFLGSSSTNSAPPQELSFAYRRPPWSRRMRKLTANPIPVPSSLVE